MNDNVKKRIIETYLSFDANTCISCGAEIPEGILVCPACERGEVPFACRLCGEPLLCDEQMCSECQARCSKKEATTTRTNVLHGLQSKRGKF